MRKLGEMMTRKSIKRQENRTKLPDMPTTVGSLPKLFPDERIVDSANRTFLAIEEILNSNNHYQALRLKNDNIDEIKANLFLIVNTYWADLHKFEGPGVAERRIALKKIEKLASKLKVSLSETPSAFRIDLNNYLKARSTIDETPTNLKIIREHLEGLIFALGVLNKEPDPERRPRKRHVADLVKAAAALWSKLTGEKFNINLDRGEDRDPITGDLVNDIVAPSPRFVRSVALAIDPELTESEVLSAISTMKSKKKK